MNKDLFKIMDWIKTNPNPNLVFAVNTNLCPPEEKWRQFLDDLKEVTTNGHLNQVEVYTSAEAWGGKAEYIRYGMNFELWQKRLWQLLEEVSKINVTVMATYNALSVSSFDKLLEEVLKIKQTERFYNKDRLVPIFIDISYLRYPEHQTVKILPSNFLSYIDRQIQLMNESPEIFIESEQRFQRGFLTFEIQKMERIKNWYLSENDPLDKPHKKSVLRSDFYNFFSEHDRRRKTNFLTTFPEFTDFWLSCKRF